MAVDRFIWEYHLTPNGWVKGKTSDMFSGKTEAAIPPDRLKTVEQEVYQSSRFSPEETRIRTTWIADGAAEQIEELQRKYPPPFKEE
ncbi:hypothetical protein [Terriglobus albidus]|uniref:hypothetical protein n=1 Tax=Terriglobus albidus TaxID=1592106 RepID=UPI0021E0E32D|nr:hypothetical protein [Terriglobus albidus]